MQKRISTLPFQGTKEQQEQLFKVIGKAAEHMVPLCPILQRSARNLWLFAN